jgi:hypothetical protein
MLSINVRVQFATDVLAYISAVKPNDEFLFTRLKDIVEHLGFIQRISLVEDTSEPVPFEWIQQIDKCFESDAIKV